MIQVPNENCRPAEHPISLITANGPTEANEVADVKLPALPDTVQPYVLDQTPAVLSVGARCADEGYSFVWPANGKPILVRPDDNVVELKSKVTSQSWMTHAKFSQKRNARRASI